jgi:hypothetical protein
MMNLSNILVIHETGGNLSEALRQELSILTSSFCGRVVNFATESFNGRTLAELAATKLAACPGLHALYMCGDVAQILPLIAHLPVEVRLFAVAELCSNVPPEQSTISLGQVPINMHGVGVFFRRFFDRRDYYEAVTREHEFQSLTLADKPGSAFRRGIYLTQVERAHGEEVCE